MHKGNGGIHRTPLVESRCRRFGLNVVLGIGYADLWQPVAMTVPPPDRMRSRAGVWQGVQHDVALIHVTLQGQRESKRRLQHHLVVIWQRCFQGGDAGVFLSRGGQRVTGLRRVQHLHQRWRVQAASHFVINVRALVETNNNTLSVLTPQSWSEYFIDFTDSLVTQNRAYLVE